MSAEPRVLMVTAVGGLHKPPTHVAATWHVLLAEATS